MSEDRDPLFEKALARHLRARSAGESLCLDPETLAAYHERMLLPEELSSAKSHIVSCARCQEILAKLETTQEANELQEATEAVPSVSVARLASAAAQLSRETLPRSLESATAAIPSKKAATIPKKKYSSLRWAAPAGAIAAALLIWIGVRESGTSMMTSSVPSEQVAENRQQSQPPQSASEQSKDLALPKLEKQKSGAPASPDQLTDRESYSWAEPSSVLRDEKKDSAAARRLESERKAPSAADEISTRTRAATGGGRGPSALAAQAQVNSALQRGDQSGIGGAPQNEAAPVPPDLDKAELHKAPPGAAPRKSGVLGGAVPAAPPPPKPVPGRLRGTVTDPAGAVVAGANVVLKSADGGTVAATSTNSSGMYSFSDVAAGNYQLELQSAGFKTDVLTGLNVAAGENVMNAKLEVGTATETVQVTEQATVISSQAAEVAETRTAPAIGRNFRNTVLLSPGLQTVASPDGKAVWKFGDMGQIFHSMNAGKDWTSEASGVAVKLLAASAPSAKVCWIAGAAGTLLRTTNGGKHWQRIAVPIAGDIGGVHASDDRHASIWDAPNLASYETADGGKTWKQSANE
jgi:Carboxypeptidase regulatory-like domain